MDSSVYGVPVPSLMEDGIDSVSSPPIGFREFRSILRQDWKTKLPKSAKNSNYQPGNVNIVRFQYAHGSRKLDDIANL